MPILNGFNLSSEFLRKMINANIKINPDQVSEENRTLINGVNHKKKESK